MCVYQVERTKVADRDRIVGCIFDEFDNHVVLDLAEETSEFVGVEDSKCIFKRVDFVSGS